MIGEAEAGGLLEFESSVGCMGGSDQPGIESWDLVSIIRGRENERGWENGGHMEKGM